MSIPIHQWLTDLWVIFWIGPSHSLMNTVHFVSNWAFAIECQGYFILQKSSGVKTSGTTLAGVKGVVFLPSESVGRPE